MQQLRKFRLKGIIYSHTLSRQRCTTQHFIADYIHIAIKLTYKVYYDINCRIFTCLLSLHLMVQEIKPVVYIISVSSKVFLDFGSILVYTAENASILLLPAITSRWFI
jgi:hypothetical protein